MWNHTEANPGEYLKVRFMDPLNLSASDLARGCRMPRSRVSDILSGKRAITADTAMRLALFFRMRPEFWMSLQADWELHQTQLQDEIVPLDPPGFLLGPSGATPIPTRRRTRPPLLRVPLHQDSAAPERRSAAVHDEVRYADGTRALVARRT